MTPKPPPSPADRLRDDLANGFIGPMRGLTIGTAGQRVSQLVREAWNRLPSTYDPVFALLSDHARLVEENGRLRAQAEADRRELDDFRTFLLGAAKQMQARAALSPSQKEG